MPTVINKPGPVDEAIASLAGVKRFELLRSELQNQGLKNQILASELQALPQRLSLETALAQSQIQGERARSQLLEAESILTRERSKTEKQERPGRVRAIEAGAKRTEQEALTEEALRGPRVIEAQAEAGRAAGPGLAAARGGLSVEDALIATKSFGVDPESIEGQVLAGSLLSSADQEINRTVAESLALFEEQMRQASFLASVPGALDAAEAVLGANHPVIQMARQVPAQPSGFERDVALAREKSLIDLAEKTLSDLADLEARDKRIIADATRGEGNQAQLDEAAFREKQRFEAKRVLEGARRRGPKANQVDEVSQSAAGGAPPTQTVSGDEAAEALRHIPMALPEGITSVDQISPELLDRNLRLLHSRGINVTFSQYRAELQRRIEETHLRGGGQRRLRKEEARRR